MKRQQSVIDWKATQRSSKKITKEINQITANTDQITYERETKDLLATYRSLGSKTQIISFGSKLKLNLPVDTKEYLYRHSIIFRYLECARKCITINVTRQIEFDNTCPNCQQNLSNVFVDENSGTQCCPCGYEKNRFTSGVSSSSDTQTKTGRNGYDDRDNFIKALHRYQGKQPNRLPENLTKNLDTYFKSYGLPPSTEVQEMELNERGIRGNTTREMMYKALYDTQLMAFYEDINLVCHIVWGWALPDVSSLEDQILEDYDKTQKVYETLPKTRKSNLNIQFRLFKHLQMRGHPCSINDFKLVKTRDILEDHDGLWKQMVEKAIELWPDDGFIYIPTI